MGDAEKMRSRFPWATPVSDVAPEIVPLTTEQARRIRLPWMSRFSTDTLNAHIRANPNLALWVPATGEYIIAEPWRRRSDIAHIMEAHARRSKEALVRAILSKAEELGFGMALMSDDVWKDNPKLYASLKFGHIERIVFFQKDLRAFDARSLLPGLPQVELARSSWEHLDLLLRLDHDSFPWLWWNSRAEFEEYMGIKGVSVYIARAAGEPVGYASFTMYSGWAHLDRLAVVTAHQGRKLGAAQLTHVLQLMREQGAASVALSTQQSNTQSHTLYQRFGFKQTREQMNFYGVALGAGVMRDA
jgi:ribosomal protein S18 acetylase RimI-like enzyme